MDLKAVVIKAVDLSASDIHMQAGSQALVRIHGQLRGVELPTVTNEALEQFLREVAGEQHWAALERDRSIDCGYAPTENTRFRVSIYFQRGLLAAAFRVLPVTIPAFETLNLPPAVLSFSEEERGLVLLTGTTSSGKSTTIASLIDRINSTQRRKIITIEDPIEYVHRDKKSQISQREVGTDTPSFSEALRRALRQDPNVIFVGELRDHETMSTAVRAADTGHLVFSTIHTTNASQTLQRIVAMFPIEERELLKAQLAANLEGVVSLRLAQRADEKGRVPVVEIMRHNPIIEKLIVESRFSELPEVLASREHGMQLFDQHLVELTRKGVIRNREALRLASNSEHVAMMLSGVSSQDLSSGILARR